jgi:hypothetical protein
MKPLGPDDKDNIDDNEETPGISNENLYWGLFILFASIYLTYAFLIR